MDFQSLALSHCRGTLINIATASQRVHDSAATYSTGQNFEKIESLRNRLRLIVSCVRTILELINNAASYSGVVDDRLVTWLFSESPQTCLTTLSKMEDILKCDGRARGFLNMLRITPVEDKLGEAIALFGNRKDSFHFLLSSEIWNSGRLVPQSPSLPVPYVDITPAMGDLVEISQSQQVQVNNGTATTVMEQTENQLGCSVIKQVCSALAPTTKQDKENKKRQDEVLRWLGALDCTKKHKDTHELRQRDTCMWLPATSVYKRWKEGEQSFLWINGKAGSGKSVLVSSIIEHLKSSPEGDTTLVFFYCDFRNKRSTCAAEVMRSLLAQFLHQLRAQSVNTGDLLGGILKEKRTGSISLTDVKGLGRFVSGAAGYFVHRPIIIIDALDECADLELLLDALLLLQDGPTRLLFTSRPLHIIRDKFAGLPLLSLEDTANKLASDIQLHVTREVYSHRRLKNLDPGLKDMISVTLVQKADGMFRWVQCQIDSLKRCATAKDLKQSLKELPYGLNETYERILLGIDPYGSEGKLALRALHWLVAAVRPLRLCEINEALAIDLEQRKFDRDLAPCHGGVLLDALGSLVTYDEKTDTIILAHFSVKEYLVGELIRSKLPMHHIRQQHAHAQVVQLCMCYIALYLKQEHAHPSDTHSESWSLLDYVLFSGFDHLAHLDLAPPITIKALTILESDIRQHPSLWERLRQARDDKLQWPYTPWPSLKHDIVLCIVIAYASERYLRCYLSRHALKPLVGTNPLIYATELRKPGHAVALLSRGADINTLGWVIDDTCQSSPLEVATNRNNYEFVDLFLQREAIATPLLLETAICMPWCSTRILARLLQSHDFVEWANVSKSERLYRGAIVSGRPDGDKKTGIEEDHIIIARRLMQVGCDLSPNSPLGEEFLRRAVYAGHVSVLEFLLLPHGRPPSHLLLTASSSDTTSAATSVIRFLLDKDIDIQVVSSNGDTALHLAMLSLSEERSLEIAKVLVNAGCNGNAINFKKETPLHIAVRRGHISVVEYLLSLGIPLPTDIVLVALQGPATARMIQWLIENGADLHAVVSSGTTAFQLSMTSYSEQDCLEIIRILINIGCIPYISDPSGQVLIYAAADSDYPSVVEYLLSQNPSLALPNDILLRALERPSSSEMIRVLVKRGGNVHAILPHHLRATALHIAVESYPEQDCLEVIDILINAGCDPSASNSVGITFIHMALMNNYHSLLEHLVSRNIPLPSNVLYPAAVEDSEQGTRAAFGSFSPADSLLPTFVFDSPDLQIASSAFLPSFPDAGSTQLEKQGTAREAPGNLSPPTDSPDPQIDSSAVLPRSPDPPSTQNPSTSSTSRRPVASQANARRRRRPAQFVCEECGQTFTALFSLNRHRQYHTGEGLFVCSIPGCGQRFFNSSDCKRHEKSRKHHKDLESKLNSDVLPSLPMEP